jgi:alpha/beta superfamily hydrolase
MSSVGVLLCNPFGYEAVCAHRSLRHIAESAAKNGLPALRFDYEGTGDSSGVGTDPGRMNAWLASIRHAVDELKQQSGVSRVCLLGVRLGATLAALAALGRNDIDSLIAIRPVVSGTRYIRELRALARVGFGSSDRETQSAHESALEVTGFTLSLPDVDAITNIDLSTMAAPSVDRAMIIHCDDFPTDTSWQPRFADAGISLEERTLPGYVDMMLDPHESLVPEQIIAAVVTFLRCAPEASVGASILGAMPTDRAGPNGERAIFLDPMKRLFGIIGLPQAHALASGDKRYANILLLNAGAVSRTGPNRMYTEVSRKLVALGHTVLRFDLGGLGDSQPSDGAAENVVYSPHAVSDIRAAAKFLRHQGGNDRELWLVGLCSGAYFSLKAALAVERVKAIIPINPLTFFWHEGDKFIVPTYIVHADVNRYKTTAFKISSWVGLLTGKKNLIDISHTITLWARSLVRSWGYSAARVLGIPIADDLAAELKALENRGTHVQFIFSDGDPGLAMLHHEGGRAVARFQTRNALRIDVIPNADHTFTASASRSVLIELLLRFIGRRGNNEFSR